MIMALDNAKDLIKTYEEHIKLYRNIIPLAGIHFINLEVIYLYLYVYLFKYSLIKGI
jgi:hypothetical protein